ncbi:MAG: alpha/beta hydrolase [Planctomycetaceae bacterium]|jgi:pimeloyl-ACP methyl ester carboxylesterase|nr:alpha/beta hydrolase [Planctomycetaceae bacterium]
MMIISQILFPAFIVLGITLFLHIAGRIFIFSPCMRASHLFSETSWLPLRYSDELPEGDEIEFTSDDGITLRGLFISSRNEINHGTILFCHELNGSRSNIAPYLETLTFEGFNVFTFDFRNHGKSDICVKDYPAPWLTAADMNDVKAAIEYVCKRENYNDNENKNCNNYCNDNFNKNFNDNSRTNNWAKIKDNKDGKGISIFGLGKGATIALCAAGSDSRVKSIVLDAPTAESRLFSKNCWNALVKSAKLARRRTINFSMAILFLQVISYSIKQSAIFVYEKWRRYVLGLWYDCQFIDVDPIIKKVNQPIMIVHGHTDTKIRPHQIRAFCERMPQRPKLWLTSPSRRQSYEKSESTKTIKTKNISEACRQSVANFFMEAN